MKKILFAVFVISIFAASCSKEKGSQTKAPATQAKKVTRIDEINNSGGTGVETYQYDEKGRLKVWVNNTSKLLFDYATNGKMMVAGYNNGVLQWNYDCDMNSKGLVTSVAIKYPDGSLYGTYTYSYNSDDYIIYANYTPVSGQGFYFNYQLENGNLVSYTQKTLSNNLTINATYTYDPAIPNTLTYSYAGAFPGDMFGRKTKNLHTHLVLKRGDGTITHEFDRAITVNNEGYVSKMKSTNTVTGFWTEATYTYE